MTVSYGFYDSLNGDRKYNAAQMSRLFQGIISDGVMSSVGTGFAVTAVGSSMVVNVGIGRAWFKNTWTYNDASLALTVDAAEAVLNRIDTVVIEVNIDTNVRANTIKIIKGTPGSSPSAPTLTNNATIGQYPLADIGVGANVTTISQANITNRIGTTACPMASALIPPFDFSLLEQQYIAQFNNWFSNLQNQLDANQATNLQNQINVLDAQEGGWIGIPHTMSHVSVDGATGVVNFNGDARAYLSRGMRLKYQQDQALSAYWNLDANSNSQVGSFNGTDTAVSYSAGKFSNAATFNGTSSKIAFTDNAVFRPAGDFTIGCWFKSAVTTGTQVLFQSWSSPAGGNLAGISIQLDTNKIRAVVGYNTAPNGYVAQNGTRNVADGNWHHAVMTYRSNQLQMYVDGRLEINIYTLNPGFAVTNYVRIGCYCPDGTDALFLSGQVDDFFIINGYALDERTIRLKYEANSAQGTAAIPVTKMGIITAIGTYSGGNTPVTFWGGTDFALVNGTITNPYYSPVKTPYGFNPNPDKWTHLYKQFAGGTQNAPATNTWYNVGGIATAIPIGAWDVTYYCLSEDNYSAAANIKLTVVTTLSTSNNSESDPDFTFDQSFDAIGSVNAFLGATASRNKTITLDSKTTYYINVSTDIATAAALYVFKTSVIRARCAYL